MPFEIFLALRFLRASRVRRVTQLTAIAAALGIACGVASYVVASALASGFRSELQTKILRGTAHLTLTPESDLFIPHANLVVARLKENKEVRRVEPTTYTGALLASATAARYAVVRGVDAHGNHHDLRETIIAGEIENLFADVDVVSNASAPAIIGAELASELNLNLQDEAVLVTSNTTANLKGNLAFSPLLNTNTQAIRVVGFFRTALHDYDASWIYVALPVAAKLSGNQERAPTVISIELDDMDAAPRIAASVKQAAENIAPLSNDARFRVVTWQQANAPLFAALTLERRVVSLIILLVTLLAALNILTTFALRVVERQTQIAVLRACGARGRSIALIFLIESLILTLIGITIGIAAGAGLCFVANRFRLVTLPADVYSISYVPLDFQIADALFAAAVALIIAFAATLYPARAAARTKPAQAFRES